MYICINDHDYLLSVKMKNYLLLVVYYHCWAYCHRSRFHPWVGKVPWGRVWLRTLVSLPGESRGQRSLAGCSPWGQSRTCLSGSGSSARGRDLCTSSCRPPGVQVHQRAMGVCVRECAQM